MQYLELENEPRHEQLYQYSKIKAESLQNHKDAQQSDLTFQPVVNDRFECEKTKLGFFERQHMDCLEREKKRLKLEYENSTSELRKAMNPQLNQSQNKSIERKTSELGKKLYERAFKSIQNREKARKLEEQNINDNINSQKVLETSRRMMYDIEEKRIREIFEGLDGDGDGLISSKRISIESLDPLDCRILGKYILQLEEDENMSMDVASFGRMMRFAMRVDSSDEGHECA